MDDKKIYDYLCPNVPSAERPPVSTLFVNLTALIYFPIYERIGKNYFNITNISKIDTIVRKSIREICYGAFAGMYEKETFCLDSLIHTHVMTNLHIHYKKNNSKTKR